MRDKVETLSNFEWEAKPLLRKYQSLKSELEKLIDILENKPDTGVSIGKGCYKIRIAIASKSKGKSGGAPIITHIAVKKDAVFLLSIYD